MLEMLKARKEELQARGEKGFTLMEMLIVIAIIAILIAIAIPLFTAQLDQAKYASDEANARSFYAIAMADYMDNNKYDNTYAGTGTAEVTVTDTENQTQTFKFQMSKVTFPDVKTTGTGETAKAPVVTMTPDTVTDTFKVVTFPQGGSGASANAEG